MRDIMMENDLESDSQVQYRKAVQRLGEANAPGRDDVRLQKGPHWPLSSDQNNSSSKITTR